MRSKTAKLLLFALLIYGAARFCHHQTSGFRMSKLQDNGFEAIVFDQPPLSEEEKTILSGKFTYFGRGLQSFAFLSEDGKYVLKIFNNRMQKKLSLLKFFHATEKAALQEGKLKKAFESYKLSFQELKEETALIYLHLNPSPILEKPVTLVDKLGIKHPIDLNKTAFALQKRATLAYPYLKGLIEKNDLSKAKEAISSLVGLLVKKYKMGIADSDPLIRTNFGFIEAKPVQIDVGPFSKSDSIQKPEEYIPELIRVTASLRDFLSRNCEELVPYLETLLGYAKENP